jgi:hypothetical protein
VQSRTCVLLCTDEGGLIRSQRKAKHMFYFALILINSYSLSGARLPRRLSGISIA